MGWIKKEGVISLRLQKYMAQCGVASRRECEKIIAEGRVTINGQVITEKAVNVDLEENVYITVDGNEIVPKEENIYIMFYKPTGVVTTSKEQFGRVCVNDWFKELSIRIFPVGRLDYETEGLLLLTNDGDFMYKITHPKYEKKKTYIAQVAGYPDQIAIEKMKENIEIDGKMTRKADVEKMGNNILKITIHEGRNRHVRRICEHGGHPVKKLKRISVGNLELDLKEPGQWRYLTDIEVKEFFK